MSSLRFIALPEAAAAAYRAGAADANGQKPERHTSDGGGNPCRHCLQEVAAGEPMLILAHRPFPSPQPYAELGPIFLHAEPCPRYVREERMPEMFRGYRAVLLRGYGKDDRIVYGTGTVVVPEVAEAVAGALLARPEVAYLHLRSASNNCFQCRIELSA